MDLCGESHEAYRRTFEFIELTNTWYDVDSPKRELPDIYRNRLNCVYQSRVWYENLAERARDSFKVVIKVSCVATHILRLKEFTDWWPKLYKAKYSKLASATVAFLWQFPPSFVYTDEAYTRLERLAEYLAREESGVSQARHIVDFRDGSWYKQDIYDFLRQKRWCLAWLHLNNSSRWASNLPSGWTDRVQTTNFCFCRLFGPDGQTHGLYDIKFLHELFDSCPMGTSTYVLFGNKEMLEDQNPIPVPAARNALSFRTIFTKMDFVERIRDLRYKGTCPRILIPEEQLLINSFYLRFSRKARVAGLKMTSPVCVQVAEKYYPEAPKEKRCFEWYFPDTDRRLHLSLHDAKEDEDLWTYLRQLTGLEDLEAAKAWSKTFFGGLLDSDDQVFTKEETYLLNGTLIRWSEKARASGLLASTRLTRILEDGRLEYTLTNGDELTLRLDDMSPSEDLWNWLLDLSRVPIEELTPAAAAEEGDPWQDKSWKRHAGEMWKRRDEEEKAREEEAKKQAEEAASWWNEDKAGYSYSSGQKRGTNPCSYFKFGKCRKGDHCVFSHDAAVIEAAGKRPCKRFQEGNCTMGNRCVFSHDASASTTKAITVLKPTGGGVGSW